MSRHLNAVKPVKPSQLFKLLAGKGASTYYKPQAVAALLKEAHARSFATHASNFERCTERFAKACQHYEEGPKAKDTELKAKYLKPAYLDKMAQAMPYRVEMPIYFHNARWPYQLARDDAQKFNPRGHNVQEALAQLRHKQASLLRNLRKLDHKADKTDVDGYVGNWERQQVKTNAELLKPFEPLRQAMRREAVAHAKVTKAAKLARKQLPNNVVPLPVSPRPATRLAAAMRA